jgi:hypothetical protein
VQIQVWPDHLQKKDESFGGDECQGISAVLRSLKVL